ncbi:MAG: hypothetical protein ABIU63_01210 [Chitinophagaceae bacterium]
MSRKHSGKTSSRLLSGYATTRILRKRDFLLSTREAAQKQELAIKGKKSRKYIEWLISGAN